MTSPLSSVRTTPNLKLIDPRLLELGVLGEGGITLANKVPNNPNNRPSPSNDNEDARDDDKTVVQSYDYISSLCISGNVCNNNDAGAVEPTASLGRTKLHADLSWVNSDSLEDRVPRDDSLAARRARTLFSSTSPIYSALLSAPKSRSKITSRYSSKS